MSNPTQFTQLMTEKEILQDCLSSQKQTAATYNTFAGECMNEQLRTTMLNILNDEQKIQSNLFQQMHQNGWYPVAPADPQKVAEAKKRFAG